MKIRDLRDLIMEHGLLASLGEEITGLLAGCARNVRFGDGAILMKEGDPADCFYLIREGRVALQIEATPRAGVVIQTLKRGEAVGLSWLVAPYRANFTARAVGPVGAIEFDAVCLRGKCDADPAVGYAFYRCLVPVLVDRLRTARLQALDVYAPAPDAIAGTGAGAIAR